MAIGFGARGGRSDFDAIFNSLATSSAQTTWALLFYRIGNGGQNRGALISRGTPETPGDSLFHDGDSNSLRLTRPFSTTAGVWSLGGFAPSMVHRLVVKHDASSTANIPVAFANGSQISVSTITSPVGTYSTTTHPLLIGNTDSGTRRLATYRITPPGGSWDAADNTTYSMAIESSQIQTVSGTSFLSGAIGSFVVSVGSVPSDTVAPEAQLVADPIVTAGRANYDFCVIYSDPRGINQNSLSSSNLTVTRPTGGSLSCTLVGYQVASGGNPVVATYRVNAPNGTWADSDNGTYTVVMGATQVRDVLSNYIAAGSIGTFNCAIGGEPSVLRVQLEDFTTYFDTTAGNTSGAYRSTDVDIESYSEGFQISWIAAGEWLEQTITIPATGYYSVRARVNSGSTASKTFRISLNGTTFDTFTFTANFGWGVSFTLTGTANVLLNKGTYTFRFTADTGSFNADWVEFFPTSYTPLSTTLRVEGESFTVNVGTVVESSSLVSGGQSLGFINPGDYTEYSVFFQRGGYYTPRIRAASGTTGTKNVQILIDGVAIETISFTDSSGWSSWITVQGVSVTRIPQGYRTIRIAFSGAGCNFDYLEFELNTSTPMPYAFASTVTASYTPYDFNVLYTANSAIDRASIDSSDIRVTGTGFDQVASLVSLTTIATGLNVFDGWIAGVAVWHGLLSDSDMQTLSASYNPLNYPTNLVAYIPCVNLSDQSINGGGSLSSVDSRIVSDLLIGYPGI